jgi:osmotically-inducible protein OsmY
MRALLLVACLGLSGCAAFVLGTAAVTALTVHDRRGVRVVFDDGRIESSAHRRLARDPEIAGSTRRIGVVSHNGIVLLHGEVASAALAARAAELTAGIEGVREVINALEIAPPADGWRIARDGAITARVKAGLLDITSLPGFDPSRVNVTTSGGVVYLQGLVTREEAEAVVDVARWTRGAERVVTIFEYLDSNRE